MESEGNRAKTQRNPEGPKVNPKGILRESPKNPQGIVGNPEGVLRNPQGLPRNPTGVFRNP